MPGLIERERYHDLELFDRHCLRDRDLATFAILLDLPNALRLPMALVLSLAVSRQSCLDGLARLNWLLVIRLRCRNRVVRSQDAYCDFSHVKRCSPCASSVS